MATTYDTLVRLLPPVLFQEDRTASAGLSLSPPPQTSVQGILKEPFLAVSGTALSVRTAQLEFTTLFQSPPRVRAAASAGGALTAGTYYYRVSTLYGAVEIPPHMEVSVTLDGAELSAAALRWDAEPLASGYRVYRGLSSGVQGEYFTTAAPELLDSGAAGTAGAPPSQLSADGAASVINQAFAAAGGIGTIANVSSAGRVMLSDPALQHLEIMVGNAALGLYEAHDLKAFLKILSPEVDVVHDEIRSIFDIVDVDRAPFEFLRQISLLLGRPWDDSKDRDVQARLVKDFPFVIRMKGSIPAIERIVRLHGGRARVFQPYPYVAKYDAHEFDGARLFTSHQTRTSSSALIVTTCFGTALGPFSSAALSGTVLAIALGESVLGISFEDLDLWEDSAGALSAEAVAAYINERATAFGVVALARAGAVILQSPATGLPVRLVVGNDVLGLEAGGLPGFRVIDTSAAPFTPEDVFRNVYIPDMPGPIRGFQVTSVVSPAEVEIRAASPGDASGVFYRIEDRDPVAHRIQSRSYWHEGVYELEADIPTHLYKDEVLTLVHPAGRVIYFAYLDESLVNLYPSPILLYQDVTLSIDQVIPLGDCGAVIDVGPGYDMAGSAFDGCQTLFGIDVTLAVDFITSVRRHLDWSQLMHWEDLTGELSYVDAYRLGQDLSTIVHRPEGHLWSDELLDAEPPAHHIVLALSPPVERGLTSTDDLSGALPPGARVLAVNEGGTFDLAAGLFSDGTDYTEGLDWQQLPLLELEWSGVSEPAAGEFYRLYLSVDPFALAP